MQQIVRPSPAKDKETREESSGYRIFASAKKSDSKVAEPTRRRAAKEPAADAPATQSPLGVTLTVTLPETDGMRRLIDRLPGGGALRQIQAGETEARLFGLGNLWQLKVKLDGPLYPERRKAGPRPTSFDKLPALAALNAFDSLPPEVRLKLAENLQETAERAVGAYIQESFGMAASRAAENVPLADRLPTQEIADRTAKIARRFLPFVK